MTKTQNNAHLCGMQTHNKFLFKAPTIPSTQVPQTFINISFEGEERVHLRLYGVSVRLRVFEEWTLIAVQVRVSSPKPQLLNENKYDQSTPDSHFLDKRRDDNYITKISWVFMKALIAHQTAAS